MLQLFVCNKTDEFVIGGQKSGKRSRCAEGKTIIAAAVEHCKVRKKIGRFRPYVLLGHSSFVKRLIIANFQGRFEPECLQNILVEYVFRFNRRKSKYIGKKFMRIVQQVVSSAKIRWDEINWDLNPISGFLSLDLSG